MADVAIGEIAALVDVAAGDQSEIDRTQHLDETATRWHRNVADRARFQLGIVGCVQINRFVQEQCDGFAMDACKFGREPLELLGFADKTRIHH